MADRPYTTQASDVIVVEPGQSVPSLLVAIGGNLVPYDTIPWRLPDDEFTAWLANISGSRPEDIEETGQ